MLADGRAYHGVADHLTLFPGLAIFIVVLSFNVLRDGLRDAPSQRLHWASARSKRQFNAALKDKILAIGLCPS
jgi:hypothetical protein